MASYLLPAFSVAVIIFAAMEILIPFLNRKRDLVTFYTFFLFGTAIYVGVSGFDSYLNPKDFRGISEEAIAHFEAGAIIFYFSLWFAYRSISIFDPLAKRWSRLFPRITRKNWLAFAIPCTLFFSLRYLAQYSFIFSYASVILSQNSLVILCFVLYVVASKKKSLMAWMLFAIVFLGCLYFSIQGGSGRRRLVSSLAIVPTAYYWIRFRPLGTYLATVDINGFARKLVRSKKKSRGATTVRLLLVGVFIVLLLNGYSGVRYRFKSWNLERNFSNYVETISMIPAHMFRFPDTSQMLGQHAVKASLNIISDYFMKPNDKFKISHFHTPIFVASNPIPRSTWPRSWGEKPESLGNSYPREAGYWERGYVNIGPGIIGQCFHEGGWHILLIYGVSMGIGFRFLDSLLVEERSRELLVALLAAGAGPVMGMSRGCLSVFTVELVAAIGALILICVTHKFLRSRSG